MREASLHPHRQNRVQHVIPSSVFAPFANLAKTLSIFFVLAGIVFAAPETHAASVFWDSITAAHVDNTVSRWQGFEESCGKRLQCQGGQAEALALVRRERQRLEGGKLDTRAVNAVADFLSTRLPYADEGYRYVDFDGIEALKRGRGVCWVYALAAYALLQGIDPAARLEFRLAKPPGNAANHAYTTVWADGIEYDLEQSRPQAVWAAQSYLKDYPVYLVVRNKRSAARY